MGLDMYLTAKKYHSDGSWRSETERDEFQKLKDISNVGTVIDKVELPHIYLEVSVGYWRKQNQIHKWFVDNIASGKDNCQAMCVDRDQLQELRSLCLRVLSDNSLAVELLPPSGGFFFGGTEIDEWYLSGIAETLEIVNTAIAMDSVWEFEYSASW